MAQGVEDGLPGRGPATSDQPSAGSVDGGPVGGGGAVVADEGGEPPGAGACGDGAGAAAVCGVGASGAGSWSWRSPGLDDPGLLPRGGWAGWLLGSQGGRGTRLDHDLAWLGGLALDAPGGPTHGATHRLVNKRCG